MAATTIKLKLNFNGFVYHNTNNAGCGGFVRNDTGLLVVAIAFIWGKLPTQKTSLKGSWCMKIFLLNLTRKILVQWKRNIDSPPIQYNNLWEDILCTFEYVGADLNHTIVKVTAWRTH